MCSAFRIARFGINTQPKGGTLFHERGLRLRHATIASGCSTVPMKTLSKRLFSRVSTGVLLVRMRPYTARGSTLREMRAVRLPIELAYRTQSICNLPSNPEFDFAFCRLVLKNVLQAKYARRATCVPLQGGDRRVLPRYEGCSCSTGANRSQPLRFNGRRCS